MKRLCFVLCSILGACGSSTPASDAGPATPDAGPVNLPLPAGDRAFCVTLGADYTNNVGSMAVVGLPSLTVLTNLLPDAVGGDPVIRTYGGNLYIVNRGSNNVTVVDLATFTVTQQFSTGASSNPQDIAIVGKYAYVTVQYGASQVQVWDLSQANPAAPFAMIDLASDDPDGNPNANSIYAVSGTLYVTVDLLDSMSMPEGPGEVVVIDSGTNTVSGTLTLNYADPYDFIVADGTKLLVPTDGDFSGTTGCLETIQTGVPSTIGPCYLENSTFGGTISATAVGADGSVYFAGSKFDANFNETAALYTIDPSGALLPGVLTPPTQLPTDIAWAPTNELVYPDGTAGGIRVYDLGSQHELTTSALNIGLPPARTNAIVCLPK